MKKLSREAFDRARDFIKAQARPLDRALFEHRFEGASADLVIAELACFQNDDGGFGHGASLGGRRSTVGGSSR